jgi:ribose transport system permease protein
MLGLLNVSSDYQTGAQGLVVRQWGPVPELAVFTIVVLAVAYLICGSLARLSGALLGAYSSPSLGIGDPVLLNSIAVVVIGGSLIQGGRSNAPGVWGGHCS